MGLGNYKVIYQQESHPAWGSGIYELRRRSLAAAFFIGKELSQGRHTLSVQVVDTRNGRVWPIAQKEDSGLQTKK